jgi:phenylacetic acid degradation protein paaN
MSALLDKHRETLQQATAACNSRTCWSGFVESPSTRIHGEEAPRLGREAFENQLGRPFELEQPGEIGRLGEEVSPYSCELLGIDYPEVDVAQVCRAALQARQSWRKVDVDTRAAVCIELLREMESNLFENAHATMHTAGQAFMMGFVGSGANALDRGLEAVVYAHKAMTDIPATASWRKPFGKGEVALDKRYHYVPLGLSLVICCASFPAWNAYPAIMANLMTGNPVILKPHPNGILPMAIATRLMRSSLARHGFDPNLLILAPDTRARPIAGQFMEREELAIIDFTGSQRYGSWLEQNMRHKLVYTETSGVNSVIVESSDDPQGMIDAIAHSLCLFSAQMCTSAQNIRFPRVGIDTPEGRLSLQDFSRRLVEAVDRKTSDPGSAAALSGAIQAPETVALMDQLAGQGRVLRQHQPYAHPEYAAARTATPLILAVDDPADTIHQQEHFGPISFVVADEDSNSALACAARDARQHGAISTYLYSTDNDYLDRAEEALIDAGASFTCNLTGPMPLNYGAAYSDLHVSGLNPAGNACLTSLAFVSNRYRIAQCRWPHGSRS